MAIPTLFVVSQCAPDVRASFTHLVCKKEVEHGAMGHGMSYPEHLSQREPVHCNSGVDELHVNQSQNIRWGQPQRQIKWMFKQYRPGSNSGQIIRWLVDIMDGRKSVCSIPC